MKELKELLKKLEAMSLEEFNEKIAVFIKNSIKMGYIKNLVNDWQQRFGGEKWHGLHNGIDFQQKLNHDPDQFNEYHGNLDWKDAWRGWWDGK